MSNLYYIENPTVLDTYDYDVDTDWKKQTEIWAEKEDRDYQDKIFENMEEK